MDLVASSPGPRESSLALPP